MVEAERTIAGRRFQLRFIRAAWMPEEPKPVVVRTGMLDLELGNQQFGMEPMQDVGDGIDIAH